MTGWIVVGGIAFFAAIVLYDYLAREKFVRQARFTHVSDSPPLADRHHWYEGESSYAWSRLYEHQYYIHFEIEDGKKVRMFSLQVPKEAYQVFGRSARGTPISVLCSRSKIFKFFHVEKLEE